MQPEPTPTQKSARKWQLRPFATSCVKDYEGHSLVQTSVAELPDARKRKTTTTTTTTKLSQTEDDKMIPSQLRLEDANSVPETFSKRLNHSHLTCQRRPLNSGERG